MSAAFELSFTNQWLMDSLPLEVFIMNKQAQLVYANKTFIDKLGYSLKEIEKLSVFDINTTATQESWESHWKKMSVERELHFKETHKNKKGKLYDVEVFAQFFSNNGKEYIRAVANDISKSTFYKYLMESTERIAGVGGWKLNLQDGSLIVTTETYQTLGIEEKDQVLPGNVIHLFKETQLLKKLLSEVIQKGRAYDEVLELKGDNTKFIRCVANPILKGTKIYKIIGIYQDVTDQISHESQLKLYKEIIDNAQDLIYVYNRAGKLIHYNDAVPIKLGFSNKELDEFTIFDLDPKITKEWWEEHFDEIIKEKALHFEWLVGRKDGSQFPASIAANHLRYNNTDLNCAVIRDITERQKKDAELFEALEEIKSLKNQLEVENEYLREEIKIKSNFDNIICKSATYEAVLNQVEQVAITGSTVLITGESGTGKELLARAIHENSKRTQKPLIKINCATLPKNLMESELFGHRKGAFTGAVENKVGKFTLADNGTLFLDEIGELPIDLQPKLLRVLQDGEFDELGGTKTHKVNVRIIAATNRDLEQMVADGTFREDLFYRLNVFPIYNIPLRDRKEDIPMLAQFFLEKYSTKAGKMFKRIGKETAKKLMAYNFPGNIRELENLIERAVIVESGTTLQPGNWIPKTGASSISTDFVSFENAQKNYIVEVLNHTNWKVSGTGGAAEILQMNDKTLFAKMKRLGIEKQVGLKK